MTETREVGNKQRQIIAILTVNSLFDYIFFLVFIVIRNKLIKMTSNFL